MTTTTANAPALAATLARLAREIEEHHRQYLRSVRTGVEAAVRAGGLLKEVKRLLPHGEFIPWVTANCSYSYATARIYMRLAANWPWIESQQEARGEEWGIREALGHLTAHLTVAPRTGEAEAGEPERTRSEARQRPAEPARRDARVEPAYEEDDDDHEGDFPASDAEADADAEYHVTIPPDVNRLLDRFIARAEWKLSKPDVVARLLREALKDED